MNRIGKFAFNTLIIVLLILGATSCKSHTHTYSNYWLFDEGSHWHESTCKHDLNCDYSEHSWSIEFLFCISANLTSEFYTCARFTGISAHELNTPTML